MKDLKLKTLLLIDYDIICLQETWLSTQQEGNLKCMNKKCSAVANSQNDDSQEITVGGKKKGVAILWNSKLDTYRTPHKYEYDWVVSIEIAYGNKRMFIFNVCLHCDKQDNEDEYLERLTKLHNNVSECDSS